MTLQPGTRLGPYEITSSLGAGGMGEVYRARDARLGREVAVKILPTQATADADRLRRFELEARAASALNHPNILTVFDVGEDDGRPFLVTELLAGRTLRQATSDGPVPIERALDWITQIGSGLAAAHEKGILHRDLKPENVFVCTDGRLKILDFGLAKLSATDATLEGLATASTVAGGTEVGTLLGTMGYMAPEQLRGEPVDARADIFALGCILHELLAGHPVFRRASNAETLAATLTETPTPAAGADSRLKGFLARCLAKQRDERIGSTRELLGELRALAEPAVQQPKPKRKRALESVAVLPFANDSDDPELEYLSDGIAESLLDALTRLPKLRVLARSSVMRFKDRVGEPIEVGRELGVGAVVTGRLRQHGDTLRVSCELARVEDGVRLWGRRYERPLADLLAVRDEIGDALADHLRGTTARRKRSTAAPAPSAAAYQAYLRGRYAWNRWTPESMRAAIRHYEEAIALEPDYALAWAGVADAWATLAQTKAIAPVEGFPRARGAAERALAIDERVAEAHASLGFVHRFWGWDWDASEGAFRRAIELAPRYATARRWYGQLFTGLGRHDEALAEMHAALELEPLSLIIQGAVGDSYFYARRFEEAVDYYRRLLEMDPDFYAGHSDLARALEHAGRTEEAVAEYERAIRMAGQSMADPSAGLANVLAVAGRRDEAQTVLTELARQRGTRYVSPWALASIHARLGEREAALDWLDRAYEEHDSTIVWLKVHPRFDALRDEPRFRALLERMRL